MRPAEAASEKKQTQTVAESRFPWPSGSGQNVVDFEGPGKAMATPGMIRASSPSKLPPRVASSA